MRLATKDDDDVYDCPWCGAEVAGVEADVEYDDAGWAKCPLCGEFVVVVCERSYRLAKRILPGKGQPLEETEGRIKPCPCGGDDFDVMRRDGEYALKCPDCGKVHALRDLVEPMPAQPEEEGKHG